MNEYDKVQLLHGPYEAPPLYRGDRATCLLRGGEVVITSMSDGPIPWPRCRALDSRGGSGLLLAGDLIRAVQTESAAAVGHWWGVSEGVVWRWRLALGIERADTEGSRRLIDAASEKGAERQRGQRLPPEQVERRRQTALALNLGRNLDPAHGRGWTADQLAMLDTDSDENVAEQIGRTVAAVRVMRNRMRRRATPDRKGGRRP
jgi:hypothetical protein